MKKYFLLFVAVGFSVLASPAQAGLSPLGISVLSPVEFPPQDFTIVGARIDLLWGDHREVYGLDLGALGNTTDVGFGGSALAGGFNYNKGTATVVGLQVAGGANINVNKAQVIGAQVAGVLNSNQAESSVVGIELAMVNSCPYTSILGVQAGLYNRAHVVTGFQIGLINVTDSLHGLQVGLANFNHTGLFAFAPILNVGF